MSVDLIIYLPETGAGLAAPWTWYKDPENFGSAETPVEKQALAEIDGQDIHVILPGQWVRVIAHDLPDLPTQDRKTALGFHIEEQLAAPLKSQHIVLSETDKDRVAVIDVDRMDETLAALADVGIDPIGIYADFDVLKSKPEPIVLADRIVYPQSGYAIDPAWTDDQSSPVTFADISPNLGLNTAINLRAGKFQQRGSINFNPAQFVRVAAVICVFGAIWLALQAVQARTAIQHATYLQDETKTLYTQATGLPAPANPALAVTQAEKTGGGAKTDFLSLSSILFQSVAQVDGVVIDTLQFDARKNQLSLRLIYPAFESTSDLEQVVATRGGQFRAGSVRERGGQLIGDAELTGEGQP